MALFPTCMTTKCFFLEKKSSYIHLNLIHVKSKISHKSMFVVEISWPARMQVVVRVKCRALISQISQLWFAGGFGQFCCRVNGCQTNKLTSICSFDHIVGFGIVRKVLVVVIWGRSLFWSATLFSVLQKARLHYSTDSVVCWKFCHSWWIWISSCNQWLTDTSMIWCEVHFARLGATREARGMSGIMWDELE